MAVDSMTEVRYKRLFDAQTSCILSSMQCATSVSLMQDIMKISAARRKERRAAAKAEREG